MGFNMRQIKGKFGIAFFGVLMFYLAIAESGAAIEISVNNSTGAVADFTSIQAAVNAAGSGDVIVVKPGVYMESITVDKDIAIVSESGNPHDTIVRTDGNSEDVFNVMSRAVVIKGFSITGAKYAGIELFGVSDCTIVNNELLNNSCGIDLYMFSSGNTIDGNNILNSGTGISLGDSWYNTLCNNSVSNCSTGISFFDSCNNTLENDSITQNRDGISLIGETNSNNLTGNKVISNEKSGIHLDGTSGNIIYNNYFNNLLNVEFESESATGLNIWNKTKTPGTNIVGGPYIGGNFWAKPENRVYPEGAKDNNLDGIFDEKYKIEGSSFIDYLPLKESKPMIITVGMKNDQDADFTSIQAAIDNASPGDIIFLRSGVYKENVNIYVTNLTLASESGSSEDTSIQAASSLNDILYVIADGVTLRGLNISGPLSYPNAAIHLNGVKNCLIENNKLSGSNSNSSEGYGIFLDHSGKNILSNNTLSDNQIGIYLKASSGNILSKSTVLNNTASGINLKSSSGNILNNSLVSGNTISILLHDSSRNLLKSNKISDSSYGIWISSFSNNNKLTNNKVSNNEVGIHLNNSSSNGLSGNVVNLNNRYGVYLDFSTGNVLSGNRVVSNLGCGLYLSNSTYSSIYNNYLKNTNNTCFNGENVGTSLNVNRTMGTNILGGSYLGGNFWATPEGKGFSQITLDGNNDGICDTVYALNNESVDYLPLAVSNIT
jgi:parallel beta-helix repeat protein